MGSLTTTDVSRLAGCTFRQTDYWVRLGLVTPVNRARGSGSSRRFTYEQAAEVRVCTILAALNCPMPVIGQVLAAVALCRDLWSQTVVVSPAGGVTPLGLATRVDGWIIDLGECRAHVGAQPVHWGDY